MKKFIIIAKWEYLERLKNKTYIFMTFFFPLLIFGVALAPALLTTEEDKETKVIGLIEKNISIQNELEQNLSSFKTVDGQPSFLIKKIDFPGLETKEVIDSASSLIFQKTIEGFIYIEKVNSDSFVVEYHSEKLGGFKDIVRIDKAINQALTKEKLTNYNIDSDIAQKITKSVEIKKVKVSPEGKENLDLEKVFVGTFAFIMLLVMSLLLVASSLVRSVVEEKSNRIIEILLSSCSAKDLMAGKIIGLSALGLTQIFVWILIAVSTLGPMILNYVQIQSVGFLILYFILGYILYSALFIGVGSIGNTEQDLQSIMSILSIIIMFPVFISTFIIENPDSKLAIIFSYIPLTTAPMMTLRVSLFDVSLIEKIATLLVLVISIYFVIWFSGKIFRIAILSYGKVPNIQEIFKWIKSK
ncbi:MAG: ABC transporter permease [Ignavibacteria bacterium]